MSGTHTNPETPSTEILKNFVRPYIYTRNQDPETQKKAYEQISDISVSLTQLARTIHQEMFLDGNSGNPEMPKTADQLTMSICKAMCAATLGIAKLSDEEVIKIMDSDQCLAYLCSAAVLVKEVVHEPDGALAKAIMEKT